MRKVLVTGASKGLGKSLCEALHDYEVIPFTRKDCDYLRLREWNCVVPETDIIVHCAGGGLGLRGPYIPAQSLYDLFMVNVGGAVELNRLSVPTMQAKGWGRVVHVLSIAAGESVGSVGYNTVKTALSGYVRSFGREMAKYGVVISGISPGAFQCGGNAMDRLERGHPDAYREFIQNRLPRGKMGTADEVISLIRYLISDEASMMGGSIVPIDAGEGHYYS